MTLRLTAIVIAMLDAFLVLADLNSRGLDQLGGYSVALLFLLTGLPALVLASINRAPRLSLGLALAFPAVFVAAFLVVLMVGGFV